MAKWFVGVRHEDSLYSSVSLGCVLTYGFNRAVCVRHHQRGGNFILHIGMGILSVGTAEWAPSFDVGSHHFSRDSMDISSFAAAGCCLDPWIHAPLAAVAIF